MRRNNHSENSAVSRATAALKETGRENYRLLPSRLKETAEKGLPGEFQFNHLRFRYITRDRSGIFRLYWLVTNGISGAQKYFYNKDYVSDTGKVRWRDMVRDMKKV